MDSRSFDDGLTELSTALTTHGTIEAADDLLAFARQDDSSPVELGSIGRFFYQVWHQMQGKAGSVNTAALKVLAQSAASSDGVSRHVRTALDYLVLWAEIDRYFDEHGLRRANYRECQGHVPAVREKIEACRSSLSTNYGWTMLAAMLISIDDRKAAAELFRSAQVESPEFAGVQRLDEFVATYFTADDVIANAHEIAGRRAKLLKHFEFLEGPPLRDDTGILLLFSCDPIFFAAFFPYWASTIEYFREQKVRLHFILVGDYAETTTAVERGLALAIAVSRLRGVEQALISETLSFSTVEVPDYVDSPRTAYACARYLLAREVVGDSGSRVFVLDIDMVMREDATESLRSLSEFLDVRLPLVLTRGLSMLVPARRHLAGRLFLPFGELGSRAMQHVENYIYLGLSRSSSWTLDQNALTYASERITDADGPETVIDIGQYVLPFGQAPARQSYREDQRRRQKARA